MKIALVCGHYLPQLGYVEVHLSKAWADLGHQVCVVTSDRIPPYVRSLTEHIAPPPDGVEVVRLRPFFTLGQIVIARGIRKQLRDFEPDLVVVVGLGKRFVLPAFGAGYPVMSLLGDNARSYGTKSLVNRIKNRILFELFKRRTYRAAVDRSAILAAYTPESFEVVGHILGGRQARKLSEQTRFFQLGFWPQEFFFDPALRLQTRADLGFDPDDVVLVTATRVSKEKNLTDMVAVLRRLPAHFKWLLVGGADDDVSRQLTNALASEVDSTRYRILPYSRRNALNAYYCAGDVGVYTVPAISIIEAAGTGLPLVLPVERGLAAVRHSIPVEDWTPSPETTAYNLQSLIATRRVRNEDAQRVSAQWSWTVQARQLIQWWREAQGDSQSE